MRKVRTLKVFEPQLKVLKVHLLEGAEEIRSKANGNANWMQAHKKIRDALAVADVEDKKKADEAKKKTQKKKPGEASQETPGYLDGLQLVMVTDDLECVPQTTTTTLSSTATQTETNVVRK